MTSRHGSYGGRKILEGTVVSAKMEKTVLVAVEERMRHRLYKKTVRRERRFMAHDEKLLPKMGDRVRIVEARPQSRHKRWLVVEIVQRVELPEVSAESIDLDLIGEVRPPEAAPADETVIADEVASEPEPVAEAEAEELVADVADEAEAIEQPIVETVEEVEEASEEAEEAEPEVETEGDEEKSE